MEDAIKGGESAKMNPISLGDLTDQTKAGNQVGVGSMVEAKVALEWIDALIPALAVVLFHRFGYVIKKGDMQLSAKEKDTLAPLLQKCLDQLLINFNSPWVALGITATVIYGSKVMEHGGKAKIDKEKAEKDRVEKTESGKTKTSTGQPAMKAMVSVDTPIVDLNASGTLRNWDETDLAKVLKKRKRGRADAEQWLNDNWIKKGGTI